MRERIAPTAKSATAHQLGSCCVVSDSNGDGTGDVAFARSAQMTCCKCFRSWVSPIRTEGAADTNATTEG